MSRMHEHLLQMRYNSSLKKKNEKISIVDVYRIDVHPPNVGPNRTQVTCPSCHANVVTNVSHESTTKTHLMALLCCVLT